MIHDIAPVLAVQALSLPVVDWFVLEVAGSAIFFLGAAIAWLRETLLRASNRPTTGLG